MPYEIYFYQKYPPRGAAFDNDIQQQQKHQECEKKSERDASHIQSEEKTQTKN